MFDVQVISLGALDSLARKQASKAPVDIFGSILKAVPQHSVARVHSVLTRLQADSSFQGVQQRCQGRAFKVRVSLLEP